MSKKKSRRKKKLTLENFVTFLCYKSLDIFEFLCLVVYRSSVWMFELASLKYKVHRQHKDLVKRRDCIGRTNTGLSVGRRGNGCKVSPVKSQLSKVGVRSIVKSKSRLE